MTVLVADVGGTNTRIALVQGGGITRFERYENATFASFYEALTRFVTARPLPELAGCCIAIAGPVTSGRASLTNCGWVIDVATVVETLPAPPLGPVHLINDLAALGYALADLTPRQLRVIRPATGKPTQTSQALVAGMGTGFNICAVKTTAHGPMVFEAEMGHAPLPASVALALAEVIGPRAAEFATIEDLLSGRGLARLFQVLSNGQEKTGHQVLAGYDPARRDAAATTVELTARMLGLLTRELAFQYLPFGGIHFAGGAARGVLCSAAQALFLEALNAPGPFADYIAFAPVCLITDDAAGLIGAARYAQR